MSPNPISEIDKDVVDAALAEEPEAPEGGVMIKDEKIRHELNTASNAFKALPAWMQKVQSVKAKSVVQVNPRQPADTTIIKPEKKQAKA